MACDLKMGFDVVLSFRMRPWRRADEIKVMRNTLIDFYGFNSKKTLIFECGPFEIVLNHMKVENGGAPGAKIYSLRMNTAILYTYMQICNDSPVCKHPDRE